MISALKIVLATPPTTGSTVPPEPPHGVGHLRDELVDQIIVDQHLVFIADDTNRGRGTVRAALL